jgi:hypothetical protein
VVSGGVKFRVKFPTRKAAYPEEQTHGYEVDLVGARANRLVLTSVKSAFGSRGVVAEHVIGETPDEGASRRYRLLNDEEVREAVVAAAADRYGYREMPAPFAHQTLARSGRIDLADSIDTCPLVLRYRGSPAVGSLSKCGQYLDATSVAYGENARVERDQAHAAATGKCQ